MDPNQIPPNQQYVGWYDMPKEEFGKEFPPYDKDLKRPQNFPLYYAAEDWAISSWWWDRSIKK